MMLRDLEQLLHQVRNAEQRNYMAEAIRCYSAGAYRAAVVIAVAAGMDDLRKKLNELAASGGATPAITAARDEIEKRVRDASAFEAQLINYCRNTVDMLTTSEGDKLELVLKTRHLCAHPSGHPGSAEEARDAIASMIDLILSRPAAMGMAGVTSLLLRLAQPTFFPNKGNEPVAKVVHHEVVRLHASILSALSRKLVDVVKSEATKPHRFGVGRSDVRDNAVTFLRGMLVLDGVAADSVLRYIADLIEEPASGKDALSVLSARPMSISKVPPVTRDRCIAAARRHLQLPEARTLVRAWGEGASLGPEDRAEISAAALSTLGSSSKPDLEALADIGWPELLHTAVVQLVEAAGTNDWNSANNSIAAIQGMPSSVAVTLSEVDRAHYVLHVARHSQGSRANHAAAALLQAGLGERADWVDALATQVAGEPAQIAATYTDWDAVIKLLAASGRGDLKSTLLAFLVGHATQVPSGLGAVLSTLSTDPDPAIARAAAAARATPSS